MVRAVCAQALGQIGVREDAVLRALRSALKDPDPEVRQYAKTALRRLQAGESDARDKETNAPKK